MYAVKVYTAHLLLIVLICQASDLPQIHFEDAHAWYGGTGSGYGACDVAYLLWSEMATNVVEERCKMPRGRQELMAPWYTVLLFNGYVINKSRAESAVADLFLSYDTVTSMIHPPPFHSCLLSDTIFIHFHSLFVIRSYI